MVGLGRTILSRHGCRPYLRAGGTYSHLRVWSAKAVRSCTVATVSAKVNSKTSAQELLQSSVGDALFGHIHRMRDMERRVSRAQYCLCHSKTCFIIFNTTIDHSLSYLIIFMISDHLISYHCCLSNRILTKCYQNFTFRYPARMFFSIWMGQTKILLMIQSPVQKKSPRGMDDRYGETSQYRRPIWMYPVLLLQPRCCTMMLIHR